MKSFARIEKQVWMASNAILIIFYCYTAVGWLCWLALFLTPVLQWIADHSMGGWMLAGMVFTVLFIKRMRKRWCCRRCANLSRSLRNGVCSECRQKAWFKQWDSVPAVIVHFHVDALRSPSD